jgi:hypothetical protein
MATFEGHKGPVFSVAFSPDGGQVLTGSVDNTARLWEAATGKPVATFKGHTGSVASVAFSPDGRHVLTGSDNTARLWEAATGKLMTVFERNEGDVRLVAFSPGGRQLLTIYNDTTVRLWYRFTSVQALVDEVKSTVHACLTIEQRDRFHLPTPTPRNFLAELLRPQGARRTGRSCARIAPATTGRFGSSPGFLLVLVSLRGRPATMTPPRLGNSAEKGQEPKPGCRQFDRAREAA